MPIQMERAPPKELNKSAGPLNTFSSVNRLVLEDEKYTCNLAKSEAACLCTFRPVSPINRLGVISAPL